MDETNEVVVDLHTDQPDSLPQPKPPDSLSWRKPFLLITWGFCLQLFTLNFAFLQILLPCIGVALQYSGFRLLRRENKLFALVYKLSIANLFLHTLMIGLAATPNQTPIWIIPFLFRFVYLFVFRNAIHRLYDTANCVRKGDPILWLLLLQIAMLALALSGLGQLWTLALPAILLLFILLNRIYRLHRPLDAADYVLLPTPSKCPQLFFGSAYLVFCGIVLSLCCAFTYHQPPKGEVYTPPVQTETRAKLIALGFDQQALQDLSDETVERFRDAVYVNTYQDLLYFTERQLTPASTLHPWEDCLQAKAIYIELPEQEVYILQHVEWIQGGSYWQDAFRFKGYSFEPTELEGNLLYERNGRSYQAPISNLAFGPHIQTSPIFSNDSHVPMAIEGTLTFPFGSTKQRAYFLFRMNFIDKQHSINSTIFDFGHMSDFLRFPYASTQQAYLDTWTNISQQCLGFEEERTRLDQSLPEEITPPAEGQ